MPTYDYQCTTCGVSFELFQSFSEDALTKCPTRKSGSSPAGCTAPGRGKVVKVFSAPGIAFKGSGFYKTDSRSSGSSSSGSDKGSSDTGGSKEKSEKSAKSDTSKKSETSGSASASSTATSGSSSSSSSD